jgi:hypothetical protein
MTQHAHTQPPFPLLPIYEDSLHNRWQAESSGGASFNLDSSEDVGRLPGGRPVPCGRSMSAILKVGATSSVSLRTNRSVVTPDQSSILLSIAFRLSSNGVQRGSSCASPIIAAQGNCAAEACVAVRQRGEGDALLFVPICGGVIGAGSSHSPSWRQAHLPLRLFGIRQGGIDELVFVAGTVAQSSRQAPALRLELDDIWISSQRRPFPGESPPSYGRPDFNSVRTSWLQGVRPGGAASTAKAKSNPHFCEYMTSEVGQKQDGGSGSDQKQRPLCRMDGDHLSGRWLQTCDPRLIRRPDHFAYGRALPPVRGTYDYRICYRQSATERMRNLQSLSWSWRPKSCALAPVRGEAFDRWLGTRTILFLGDSLSAQQFYSLIWLLGDAVTSLVDVAGVTPEERSRGSARSEQRVPTCASSVGNEGGWLTEARLRSGGRLVKVLRHTTLFDELRRPEAAWWQPWLALADIVVLNVGHHYHAVDKGFKQYGRLAHVVMQALERAMRPAAQLVFRTTNVGHPACENATRPLRSRREAWTQLTDGGDIWTWRAPRKGVDMFKDKYSWRGPALFEHEWRAAASRAASLRGRFAYLNVSFLDMRADGHVASSMRYSAQRGKREFPLDCLHYCYPGPTDFWALSLYNLLLNNARYK